MIRFANKNDIEGIMEFIDLYWKKGHILASDRSFFEYEHVFGENVSYVVSLDDNGCMNGILGYIPYGKTARDVMTVMWKVNHTAHASLGLELFQFLRDNGDVRIMASPGSNPKLKGLYRYLGYQFNTMTHWYRLNKLDAYKIADVQDFYIPKTKGEVDYIQIHNWADMVAKFAFDMYDKNSKPYKESWYIQKRYFNHPKYKYEIFVAGYKNDILDKNERYPLALVFRVQRCNGTNALRLIDCIGDFSLLSSISNLLDDALRKYDAEYVDLYEAGLPDLWMTDAGFKKVSGSGNIIPNYFSPFVRENIDIYYFSSDSEIVLFKGDGDQDRPS